MFTIKQTFLLKDARHKKNLLYIEQVKHKVTFPGLRGSLYLMFNK